MKKLKNHGITLISLIVTIIILLILAGISISLIAGGNGILGRASGALDANDQATATEKMELKITYLNMISYGENTRKANLQELAEGMFQDKEIEYVKVKEQKVASLEAIDVTGENSIFVKLKEYPYEFEIGSDLQLASVDGVKIAKSEPSEQVTMKDKDDYIINETYIQKDNAVVNVAQFGKVVYISYDLTAITNLPNGEHVLASGLPTPVFDFNSFLGSDAAGRVVRMNLSSEGELCLFWAGFTIPSGYDMLGTFTYLTN